MFLAWISAIRIQSSGAPSGSFSAPTQNVPGAGHTQTHTKPSSPHGELDGEVACVFGDWTHAASGWCSGDNRAGQSAGRWRWRCSSWLACQTAPWRRAGWRGCRRGWGGSELTPDCRRSHRDRQSQGFSKRSEVNCPLQLQHHDDVTKTGVIIMQVM